MVAVSALVFGGLKVPPGTETVGKKEKKVKCVALRRVCEFVRARGFGASVPFACPLAVPFWDVFADGSVSGRLV